MFKDSECRKEINGGVYTSSGGHERYIMELHVVFTHTNKQEFFLLSEISWNLFFFLAFILG